MRHVQRVVVCDDDDIRVKDWAERLDDCGDGLLEVTALEPVRFNAAVAALKDRKALAKNEDSVRVATDAADIIDDADILVLDSDLTPDDGPQQAEKLELLPHLVGELGDQVAHLARGYSKAGVIVVVNQKWRTRTFDLTMQEFADGPADIYVSESDMDNNGLWTGTPIGGYRPWSWPQLNELPEQLAGLQNGVELDDPVLAALGLDRSPVFESIDARQLDTLGYDEDLRGMTFRDVSMVSSFGYLPKERVDPERLKAMAVSGVRRWLERCILPTQTVLIDRPHLLQRRPWLVSDRGNLDAWNDPANWWHGSDSVAPDAGYAAEPSRWLGRHVWYWPLIAGDARPVGANISASDPVFCEDSSRFVLAPDARDFESNLGGATAQRFVELLSDVHYNPRHRLLT